MWNTVADARRGTQTFPKSVVDKDRHFPFFHILQRPTTFLRLSAASTPTVCSCKPRTRPSTFLAIRRLTRCLSLPDPTSKCCVSRKKRNAYFIIRQSNTRLHAVASCTSQRQQRSPPHSAALPQSTPFCARGTRKGKREKLQYEPCKCQGILAATLQVLMASAICYGRGCCYHRDGISSRTTTSNLSDTQYKKKLLSGSIAENR